MSVTPRPRLTMLTTPFYCSKQGERLHMEDTYTVYHAHEFIADWWVNGTREAEEQQLDFVSGQEDATVYHYYAVFDGHGGKEAAEYARDNLLDHIRSQDGFLSDDDDEVLEAIRNGFLECHSDMWNERGLWGRENAGTTASVAFIIRDKVFIGHVGDSGIVLGFQNPDAESWQARKLTKDHKPEDPEELARIRGLGGEVRRLRGDVPRVVWKHLPSRHEGRVTENSFVRTPFLNMSRALGDFWSYVGEADDFLVSPEPQLRVIKLDASLRCLILATDGFWNVVDPQEAVDLVDDVQEENQRRPYNRWKCPSEALVTEALDNWDEADVRADNTTVVTVCFDLVLEEE